MIVTVGMSIYTTRLVLEYLGVVSYGVFSIVAGSIALLAVLSSSLSATSKRFIAINLGSKDYKNLNLVFNNCLIIHFCMGIAIALLLELLGLYLFDGFLDIPSDTVVASKWIYHTITIMTVVRIISLPFESLIISNEDMGIIAGTDFLVSLLKLLLAFYLGSLTENLLLTFGVFMALIPINKDILQIIYSLRKYHYISINVLKYFQKYIFIEMLGFTKHMLIGSFAGAINGKGRDLVLNFFFGPIVNAAQAVTSQVSGQLQSLSNVFSNVLDPVIIKNEGEKNRNKMIETSLLGTLISVYLLLVLVIPFLIEIEYLFGLWLKEIPEYTIIFTQLFLVRVIINQFYIQLQTSILAMGNVQRYQIIYSFFKILPIFITILLFNVGYAPYYLYINLLLAEIVILFVVLLTLKYQIKYQIYSFFKLVLLPASIITLSSASLGLLVFYQLDEGILNLIMVTVTCVLTASVSFLFFGLSTEIRKKVYHSFKTLIKKRKSI
jgi:O-antigen/teichoic acid export membrane protein